MFRSFLLSLRIEWISLRLIGSCDLFSQKIIWLYSGSCDFYRNLHLMHQQPLQHVCPEIKNNIYGSEMEI